MKIKNFFISLLFVMFLSLHSWALTMPIWILLILHRVIGLPLAWVWVAVGLWLVSCLVRALMIVFASTMSQTPRPNPENKNPYSKKNEDLFKK